MLISLSKLHKEHINILTTQPNSIVIDLCKLAINYLQNGIDLKRCKIAAEKLHVQQETIENCIYGLVNLLTIACRSQISDVDFRDSLLGLGFDPERQGVLSKFYESQKQEISQLLEKLNIHIPHYDNLEWRLEVQVASRSLLHQISPFIGMKLTLNNNGHRQDMQLQTDPTNLLHITNELEKALLESGGRHSRKIQRSLND